MPRACTVCDHKDLRKIDLELVEGVPLQRIADRWGVAKTSLIRHRDNHLPDTLLRAKGAMDLADSENLLDTIFTLRRRAEGIMEMAERKGELQTALNAIRELRGIVELFAKLEGRLREGSQVNIIMNPVWIEMKTVIMNALEPFPRARAALAEALKGVEANHENQRLGG